MNLDDFKRDWQAEARRGGDAVDGGLVDRARSRAAELEKAVRRRDRLEVGAAILVGAFFLWRFPTAAPLTRLGIVIVLLAAASIVVRLRAARRPPGSGDPAAPLSAALRLERERVAAQVRLLQSVLWWYILPLAIGAVLVFAGAAGWGVATGVYALFVAALGAVIYAANQRAVRRDLRPRQEELDRLIRQLES